MVSEILTTFALTIGIFAFLILLGHTDIGGPPGPRRYAITPIVIMTAVIGLIAAVDGAAMAFLMILFFSIIYLIGLFMEGTSKAPN